jgi:hypothetical protein
MTFLQCFLFAIVPLSIAVVAVIIGESFRARHTRGAALIAIAAFTALLMQIGTVAAQTPSEVQRMAQDAIRRLDLQTEIPDAPKPTQFSLSLRPELLWFIVAVAVLLLLYSFRDLIPLLRSRGGELTEEEVISADAMRREPQVALAAADEFAREGRYREAMHILLLRSLAELRATLDEPFADSLTSREILRSARLPKAAREPLREVVGRVEWTYFGERPAEREDYEACRTSFFAIERALHGSAAA